MSENKKKGRLSFLRRKPTIPIVKSPESRTKEYIEQNMNVISMPPFSMINPQKKKEKVVLAKSIENQEKLDNYYEDPEIMKLQLVMLDRTPQNIRWAFNHDISAKTSVNILGNSIIGSTGLQVKTKNNKLKKILTKYIKDIKVNDIIRKTLKDCMCFTESVFWLDYNKEKQLIIPRQIDYITLTPIINRFTGSGKWIQFVWVDSQMPEKDNAKWRGYEPIADFMHLAPRAPDSPKDRMIKRHIFEDDVFHIQLFSSPPVIGALEIMIWKKWMEYDAKLGGQKYATPLIKAKVNLPAGYELGTVETQDLLNQVAADLQGLMNFGVLAHPENVEVDSINQSGQVFDFVRYLEYAEKQIHKAMLVPANLLQASGSELATSRTTKDMFSITVNSLRNKYTDLFHDLCMKQLDFIGNRAKEEDFELIFSESEQQQSMTQSEEFNALMQLQDRGLIKDENEIREYVAKFGMVLPQLSESELAEKEQQQLEQQLLEAGVTGVGQDDQDLMNQVNKDIQTQSGEGSEK